MHGVPIASNAVSAVSFRLRRKRAERKQRQGVRGKTVKKKETGFTVSFKWRLLRDSNPRKERSDGIASFRHLICTRKSCRAKTASGGSRDKKKIKKETAAKPPRGAKMRERCDSSAGTRSTANVLHFCDAKRSRRHTCKQLSGERRVVAKFALRRRWRLLRDSNPRHCG